MKIIFHHHNQMQPQSTATLSIIIGSLGLLLFIVSRSMGHGAKGSALNLMSKGLIALGIYILAVAVINLSDKCCDGNKK